MIAPPCLRCQAPVKRGSNASTMGPRIVHGVLWRWFCGRQCSAQDRVERRPRQIALLVAHGEATRRAAEAKVRQRLLAACQPFLDAQGKVTPADLVEAVRLELRLAYQRRYAQQRRSIGMPA